MPRLSVLGALGLAGSAMAAYIPSEPWATLTPDSGYLDGAVTDWTATFAIAVNPITTSTSASASASTALAKRAQVVSQIADGQIQATTSTATTTSSSSSAKKTTTAQVVSQIGDGQIQATTSTATTTSSSSSTKKTTTAQVVSQIGDGQIQATTSTGTTTATTNVVSQITDGQIQATTTASTSAATTTSTSDDDDEDTETVACLTDSTLAMTLNGSILTDSAGRIGSIVSNRQFQFDGPPPQAGAIYAAGWSITEDGFLAIGNNSEFYQCSSGNFYNLYDESIGSQCSPVNLEIVELVDC